MGSFTEKLILPIRQGDTLRHSFFFKSPVVPNVGDISTTQQYEEEADFPATGQSGLFYEDLATGNIFRWRNADYEQIAEPLDLTDADILIQVRSAVADESSTVLLTFTTGDGTIETPDDTGEISIEFDDVTDDEGTGQAALANAVFDIQITFENDEIRSYPEDASGVVRFTREVTRA